MEKILVSGCLLGERVRYNAEHKQILNTVFDSWQTEGRLVSICPEMAGGLPTPRPPSEILNGSVYSIQGDDVSKFFNRGAHAALELCQKHQIKMAILKAQSPSCGNDEIYDGSFTGNTIPGQGITAGLLSKHGIKVFNENQLMEAAEFLSGLSTHS